MLHADMIISGGCVVLKDNHLVVTNGCVVKSGAEIKSNNSATLKANPLTINSGGKLTGSGDMVAMVVNNGEIVINSGSGDSMRFLFDVTNHGLIRAVNNTGLVASSGLFINNGTLDIITGAGSGPMNLTGAGAFYSPNRMPLVALVKPSGGTNAIVSIQTNTYHTYLFQTSSDLSGWTTEQTIVGDGSLAEWTATDVGDALYFRVDITD